MTGRLVVDNETHMNLVHQLENDVAVADMWDAVDFSLQVSSCVDVVQVEWIIDIENHRSGAALWTGPEGLTGGGLLIWWEVVQQLLDLVGEVLLVVKASPLDAVSHRCWTFVDQGAL